MLIAAYVYALAMRYDLAYFSQFRVIMLTCDCVDVANFMEYRFFQDLPPHQNLVRLGLLNKIPHSLKQFGPDTLLAKTELYSMSLHLIRKHACSCLNQCVESIYESVKLIFRRLPIFCTVWLNGWLSVDFFSEKKSPPWLVKRLRIGSALRAAIGCRTRLICISREIELLETSSRISS